MKCKASVNTAQRNGGALFNNAIAALQNVTLGSNSAHSGGGIYNAAGSVQIAASTIARNEATVGGGLYHSVGYQSLNSSIVAENRSGRRPNDVDGPVPIDTAGARNNLIGSGGSGG